VLSQRSQLVLEVAGGDTAGAGVKFSTSLLTIRPFSPEPLLVSTEFLCHSQFSLLMAMLIFVVRQLLLLGNRLLLLLLLLFLLALLVLLAL
jgi:hypothetical protein